MRRLHFCFLMIFCFIYTTSAQEKIILNPKPDQLQQTIELLKQRRHLVAKSYERLYRHSLELEKHLESTNFRVDMKELFFTGGFVFLNMLVFPLPFMIIQISSQTGCVPIELMLATEEAKIKVEELKEVNLTLSNIIIGESRYGPPAFVTLMDFYEYQLQKYQDASVHVANSFNKEIEKYYSSSWDFGISDSYAITLMAGETEAQMEIFQSYLNYINQELKKLEKVADEQ